MKSFMVRFAFFVGGFALLFTLLSLYDQVRIEAEDNDYVQYRLFHAAKNPSVVFLGDSRPTFDVHLEHEPKLYNFAYPSENWQDILLKATVAIREKPSIRLFIVPIDDHTLGTFRADSPHAVDMLHFTDAKTINSIYGTSFESIGWHEKMTMYLQYKIPLLSTEKRQVLAQVMGNDLFAAMTGSQNTKQIHYDSKGNLTNDAYTDWSLIPKKERDQRAQNHVDTHLQGMIDTPLLKTMVGYFFAVCKAKSITVIGIRYPQSVEVQQRSRSKPIELVRDFYAQQPFLLTLDYEHLFDHHPEYFGDESHLNPKGAKIFTAQLLEDLRKKSPLFASVAKSGD